MKMQTTIEQPVRARRRGPLKPGPGRPKGLQNKTTRTFKAAMLESFDLLGGVKYLVWLGRKKPEAYSSLIGRCIPQELRGEIDAALTVTVVTQTGEIVRTPLHGTSYALADASKASMPRSIEGEIVNDPEAT